MRFVRFVIVVASVTVAGTLIAGLTGLLSAMLAPEAFLDGVNSLLLFVESVDPEPVPGKSYAVYGGTLGVVIGLTVGIAVGAGLGVLDQLMLFARELWGQPKSQTN